MAETLTETAEMTPEAKAAVAQKELETKMLQCKFELEAVLKKYNMSMRVGAPNIEILPIEAQK